MITGVDLNKTARASELAGRVVHIWSVRTDPGKTDVGRFQLLLEPEERDRAARFRFDYLRQAFILARGGLRVLLGCYLGVLPAAVRFTYGSKGKPALSRGSLEFNVSHSGGLAVFAFTLGCEIGVDVEQLRSLPEMSEIASKFFCVEETAELMALPAGERERAFFLCWTRKEAYIKATGYGLSAPLDSFRVALRPDSPARFIHFNCDAVALGSWTLHDLSLTPAYAGALAYPDAPRSVLVQPVIEAAQLLAGL